MTTTTTRRAETRPRPHAPGTQRLAVAAVLTLLVAILTACSTGSSSADSATTDSAGSAEMSQPETAAKSGEDSDGAVDTRAAGSVRQGVEQKLVRRADLNLKVGELTAAAQRIRAIAAQQSGVVVSEELHSGGDADVTSGAVTISVPAASLEATLALLEKVGDVQFRNTSSEDVTGTYVDTEARVKSMTTSVQRIRELLAKASSVTDLVALENELSQRQAELDSLTAQLTALKDRVAMSPITISLSTDDFEPVTAGGFVSGLKSGWSAFVTSMSVLVTALGAVLPFAATAFVIVGPVLWWLRRRRPAPGSVSVSATAPAGGSAPPSAG